MENLNEKTFNLLEKTGLNWTVKKEQLQTADGKQTESFGIFRNDNSGWLGTVGNRYKTFQNFEMAEMVLQAADGVNLQVERGGALFGGCKTYLQAGLPDEFIGKSGVKRFITCLNSHDGSTSIGFGSANTVVVCQNTFFKAFGEINKVRHTDSAKERLDVMMKDLRVAMQLDQALMDNFKRMADLQLKDEAIERVINSIFSVNKTTVSSEISTRKENQVKSFAGALQQSVNEQGSTIWALFNGITRYTNHIAAPSGTDKKTDYLLANGGQALAETGFNEIMKWVEENTAYLVPVLR